MDDRDCCRGCGEKRPADAPSGLCPACLLKAGLLGEDSQLPDVTITFGPASSSILASFGEAFGKIPAILLRDADSATDPGPVIRPSFPEMPDSAERSARLQLFGEIARGGMGAIFKGRDTDLGRDLAVRAPWCQIYFLGSILQKPPVLSLTDAAHYPGRRKWGRVNVGSAPRRARTDLVDRIASSPRVSVTGPRLRTPSLSAAARLGARRVQYYYSEGFRWTAPSRRYVGRGRCARPSIWRLSTELGNRGRQAHAHEEPREGLRKVFQERRLQPPTRPQSFRVFRQVIVGQAEDLTKIDHKSLAIVLRRGRRGEQVQALDATLQDLIPAPLAGEGGIDGLEFREGKDGAAGHSLTFRCSRSQLCVTMIKSP